jgi:predicted methyltransferase
VVILSHYQAKTLLAARQVGCSTVSVSPDLNLSLVEVTLGTAGVEFPGGESIDWETLKQIAEVETKCFVFEDGSWREIRAFSEETNWVRSLYPTAGAPTVLVGGVPMHRIEGTDPYRDTLAKIKTIAPVAGHVLDTATGLGYTAIEASKTAELVITIELDPASLEIARLNPWSQGLFGNPKIKQIVGDTFEEISSFEDAVFSRIIHDPPMFSLAGELYSGEFYRELWRVLRRNGRLFHYIGDLESRSGQGVARGVIRRLQEAGFTRVVRRPEAFGVVAYKEVR